MKIYAVKTLNITEKKLYDLCLLVSAEKRYKIEKFINKEDKIRTLIGEILIRTIIVEQLDIRKKFIKFDKNKYGKPYLKDYSIINFNISHSRDFVVCAIDDKPIGIDIEEIKNIEYEDITKNFFTISEFNYVIKQNLNMRLRKFYELWTLKESYIKCCGQGLSTPLKSFSIDIDKYGDIRVINTEGHNEHAFKIFDTISGYKMAVCSENKEILNNIITIDQNSLINNYSNLDLKLEELC